MESREPHGIAIPWGSLSARGMCGRTRVHSGAETVAVLSNPPAGQSGGPEVHWRSCVARRGFRVSRETVRETEHVVLVITSVGSEPASPPPGDDHGRTCRPEGRPCTDPEICPHYWLC